MKNFNKRALTLAGVLALIGAGTVFAQDEAAAAPEGLDVAGGKLKIGVYVNSGFEADSKHTTTKVEGFSNDQIRQQGMSPDRYDNELYPYAQNADNSGRAQVDLNWTSGDSKFGANVRIRANDIFNAKNYKTKDKDGKETTDIVEISKNFFYPRYAYGWYKPFKFLSVSGGLVDDTAFRTQGHRADDALDFTYGALPGGLLHITPLDFLDVGFGAFVKSDGDNHNDDAIMSDDVLFFGGLALNTKPVTFRASMVSFGNSFENAMFGVSTGLIPSLSLALEGQIFNSRNDGSDIGFWGNLSAGWEWNNLNVGLTVYYFANNYKKGVDAYWYNDYAGGGGHRTLLSEAFGDANKGEATDYTTGPVTCTINPVVSYALFDGKFIPGLSFTAGFGSTDEDKYLATYYQYGRPIPVCLSDPSFLMIKVNPFVDFPVGKGVIEVGYQYELDQFKGKDSLGQNKDVTLSTSTHSIWVDFLFKY